MAQAQRIQSDEQALEAARRFAEQIRGESAARDKERRLPFEEIEWFSQTGLWGITVPKEYGGAGVSTATFTEVVAIVSEADASIGQIPQNHYANVEEIRLVGTEEQKRFFFDRVLQGDRLGNAAVERTGKTVVENQTRLVPDGDGYRLSGEKFYCTGAIFAHWVPASSNSLFVARIEISVAAIFASATASAATVTVSSSNATAARSTLMAERSISASAACN